METKLIKNVFKVISLTLFGAVLAWIIACGTFGIEVANYFGFVGAPILAILVGTWLLALILLMVDYVSTWFLSKI